MHLWEMLSRKFAGLKVCELGRSNVRCSLACYQVSHRRRSGWNSGGTHDEGRRWIGAEWGRIWGGVSPLQPNRGSGWASWAPPAGRSPCRKRILAYFEGHRTLIFVLIWQNLRGTIYIIVPYSKFWGACPPCPPVIYTHEVSVNHPAWCQQWQCVCQARFHRIHRFITHISLYTMRSSYSLSVSINIHHCCQRMFTLHSACANATRRPVDDTVRPIASRAK